MTVLGPQRNTVVLVVSWDELDMLHTVVAAYTSDYEGANTAANHRTRDSAGPQAE